MAILNWHSITKPQIWASSALPNDSSSPPLSQNPNLKLDRLPKPRLQPTLKQQKQPQPSILEIERAIGAGVFRDRDINRQAKPKSFIYFIFFIKGKKCLTGLGWICSEAEEKANLFDNILKNTVGKNEGPLEKQLRETGEWLILQTEKTTRSAGNIWLNIFI